MSEQELREGLRAAVADEPPLAFDPDTLMAKAKREVTRRRALFGAGMATTAVLVAAVTVPTLLGPPRGGATSAGSPRGALEGCQPYRTPAPVPPPSGPPMITGSAGPPSGSFKVQVPASGVASTSRVQPPVPTSTWLPGPSGTPLPTPPPEQPCTPPSGSSGGPPVNEPPGSPVPPPPASDGATPIKPLFDWPPAGVEAKQYTAAQLKARGTEMRAHLKSQFTKVVAGATNVAVQEFGGEASGATSDGQNYLDTFVAYTVKDMRSAVGISVFAPGGGMTPDEQCAESDDGCAVREGPNGTRLVVTTLHVGGQDNKAVIQSVSAYRPNGTVVRASGYNYDPVGKQTMAVLPDMPVTVEQLTALATDPELAL